MNKVLIAGLAALGFSGGAVQAADIYHGSMKDAPIVVSKPIWTGFYLGAGVGIGAMNSDFDADVAFEDDVAVLGGLATVGFSGASAVSGVLGDDAAFGTLQIGYDKQLGSKFVIGAFADYDFTNFKSRFRATGEATTNTTFNVDIGALGGDGELSADVSGAYDQTFELEIENMWSIGGRFGVLLNPQALLYGLVAYTEADAKGAVDKTLNGFTVGGGIEANIRDNWFLKLEYRYTRLDSKRFSFSGTGGVGGVDGTFTPDADIDPTNFSAPFDFDYDFNARVDPDIHSARAVISYKLN